jgi:hypothetical protein
MLRRPLPFATLLLAALPLAAQANLQVAFLEGAPKDQFRIVNASDCTLTGASVLLDLSKSSGGLIFDVTATGAGVEVFQPFDLIEGAEHVSAMPTVSDGQSRIRLDLSDFAPGETIAFTIDVDDTLGQRAITVSGSEIEGALVVYAQSGFDSAAAFSNRAVADVPLSDCAPNG